MHEELLHLIPEELRGEFSEEYGIQIEGTPLPRVPSSPDTEKGDIARFRGARPASEERRVGIGTFAPPIPNPRTFPN